MSGDAARDRTRVLVVDDSSAVRTILAKAIDADPELELVGLARTGREALEKMPGCSPDVISLDVEMPDMNGIDFLVALEQQGIDIPVVVFSSLTKRGCEIAITALLRGARDCVLKPSADTAGDSVRESVSDTLLPVLKRVARRRGTQAPVSTSAAPSSARAGAGRGTGAMFRGAPGRPLSRDTPRPRPSRCRLVVVASSTGGPAALAALLGDIPASFPVPIAVVQHIQAPFLASLADRLDARAALDVRVVSGRTTVAGGGVWFAPAGSHLAVAHDGGGIALVPRSGDPVNSCLPSADVLFGTAGEVCGADVTGVVLTGMGADGLEGARVIHNAGGIIVAQDESTSVVWGMPGAVVNAGIADHVLPLGEIARAVLMIVRGLRPPPQAVKTSPA